jgi:hypothetical protein
VEAKIETTASSKEHGNSSWFFSEEILFSGAEGVIAKRV